jgi:hypothetical protein
MNLALEAPRPIHDMDLVGLNETAARWLESFLQRTGTPSDGDFEDGSGNFCTGKLFHETAAMSFGGVTHPGYDTYELVHNGGTGRILYDLAEHYFLTGDTKWFKKNQWRIQAAAEWIIRQRTHYMKDVPNREALAVAGLHPPQHIADCAWGQSEWKWYANIDAWYYQGLRRFGEAMAEVDSTHAGKYLDEAEQYRKALQKAVDRAVTLAPMIQVPTPIRGPSRDLRGRGTTRPSRRTVRQQVLGAEIDGLSFSWRLSPRRYAPLFLPDGRGRPPGAYACQDWPRPESPEVADCRVLNLAPGRTLRSRVAGLFLFVPLLARLHFDRLVTEARYPGSEMVPAPSALLSLLALKLLDKERHSHIDDFNCDEALGVFAGLNILPKKSFATDYSYRTGRDQQMGLLQG